MTLLKHSKRFVTKYNVTGSGDNSNNNIANILNPTATFSNTSNTNDTSDTSDTNNTNNTVNISDNSLNQQEQEQEQHNNQSNTVSDPTTDNTISTNNSSSDNNIEDSIEQTPSDLNKTEGQTEQDTQNNNLDMNCIHDTENIDIDNSNGNGTNIGGRKRRLGDDQYNENENENGNGNGNGNGNKVKKMVDHTPPSPSASQPNSRHNSLSSNQGDETHISLSSTNARNGDTPALKSILPQYSFTRYCYRHNPEYHDNQQSMISERKKSIDHADTSCETRKLLRNDDLYKKFLKEVKDPTERGDTVKFLTDFTNSSAQKRELLLKMILQLCCSPQLSLVSSEVNSLIKIDFIATLPQEISMKILSYLDCSSLCSASTVSKTWKAMADDDRIWYHLCEQHIDRKCPQCGWGLPLLQMKRRRVIDTSTANSAGSSSNLNSNPNTHMHTTAGTLTQASSSTVLEDPPVLAPTAIAAAAAAAAAANTTTTTVTTRSTSPSCTDCTFTTTGVTKTNPAPQQSQQPSKAVSKPKTRPWKVVYRERFNVERNWRKGIYKQRDFVGHLDGVLDCKLSFKLLFTGSYDCTIGIWDISTGNLVRRLTGHSQGVKTLHFDESKLITGSLDKTIRVWNYHTGQCISTYRGHTDSVLSIDAYKKIIVSGSADCTVKVWHVESRTCFTLRGHTEWVSGVKLHPESFTCYSCSDDMTIKMWDIRENKLLKTFNGHVGQVQKVIPLTIIDEENLVTDIDYDRDFKDPELNADLRYPTHLLSCSLDNTIKLWHVQSGTCIRTHFGHVEGVWDIAADNFRIVSGSHDKTVKVWDLQSGRLIHSFNKQHQSPVTCVDIGDSEFVSGDETGKVSMFHFDV